MPKDAWLFETVAFTAEHAVGWEIGDTRQLTGRCPACDDYTVADAPTALEYLADAREQPVIDAPVFCDCACSDRSHPGRPEGVHKGCGASWVLRVDTTGKKPTVTAEFDPKLRASTETAYRADQKFAGREGESAGITLAAERWIPGIAAILGTISLSSVLLFRDIARTLDPGFRIAAFALVASAVAASASAIALSYLAAYGRPRQGDPTTVSGLLKVAHRVRRRPSSTAGRLRGAVTLACLAVALLLTALGLLWFGPVTA